MIDKDKVNMNEIKDACRALNSSDLAKVKIKGVKKAQLLIDFAEAVEGIPEEREADIPTAVIEFYNKYCADDATGGEEQGSAAPEGGEGAEIGEVKLEAKKRGMRSESKMWVRGLIEDHKYTRKEIIDMYVEKYGEHRRRTIQTMLTDSKNPDIHTKAAFDKLAATDVDGCFYFIE